MPSALAEAGDVEAGGDAGHAREEPAQREPHERAGQQRHVQPADRQHVGEPGRAHVVARVVLGIAPDSPSTSARARVGRFRARGSVEGGLAALARSAWAARCQGGRAEDPRSAHQPRVRVRSSRRSATPGGASDCRSAGPGWPRVITPTRGAGRHVQAAHAHPRSGAGSAARVELATARHLQDRPWRVGVPRGEDLALEAQHARLHLAERRWRGRQRLADQGRQRREEDPGPPGRLRAARAGREVSSSATPSTAALRSTPPRGGTRAMRPRLPRADRRPSRPAHPSRSPLGARRVPSART